MAFSSLYHVWTLVSPPSFGTASIVPGTYVGYVVSHDASMEVLGVKDGRVVSHDAALEALNVVASAAWQN